MLMRRWSCWLGALGLGLCLGACVETSTDGREAVATAEREQGLIVPSALIAATTITLPNGDAADVYAPALPPPLRRVFADRFPVVVHLQGALVGRSAYRGFGLELARHGFVVVIPDHLRAFGPPGSPPVPFTEANVIGSALDAIETLDADPSSPLHLVADTSRLAISGHSFGGVVALQALAGSCTPPFCTPPFVLPAEAGAFALYGTHMVVQTGVIDIDTHGKGVALVHGDLDGRAPAAPIVSTYATLDDARALITVHGANHYAICDSAAPAGSQPDPNPQTLDQETSVRAIATWTGRWFRDQLLDDPLAQVWLYVLAGALDGGVEVQTD